MKVVLDTNVLVSAFIFPGGPPEDVYRLALEGRVELVTSLPLLAELARVLEDRFGWDAPRVEEAVSQLARLADVVKPRATLRVVKADPADDRVLEAADAGGAEVVVPGDRHLLQLGSWRGIRIEKAADFLAGMP